MDYFNARQYLSDLPAPMFIISQRSGKVLFANRDAENKGIYSGVSFFRMLEKDTDLSKFKSSGMSSTIKASVKISDTLYDMNLSLSECSFNGIQSLIITISKIETAYRENAAEVIIMISDLYKRDNGRNRDREYLALTAKSCGAFCAALYEKKESRFILSEEWRESKSVCIPILSPDFEENAVSEVKRLSKLKRAEGSAYARYRKMYGTTGVAIYFLNEDIGLHVKQNIERYTALYCALNPDSPKNNTLITLKKALDTLGQGFAVWEAKTRKLLYDNKTYRSIVGYEDASILSEYLGKNLETKAGRPCEETYKDAQGRHYCVTHTKTRLSGKEIIATVITDATKTKETENRLDAMARTDALTGLMNRRAGMEQLAALYEECKSKGQPFTVCFADIDGLKYINDTYGHGAGDVMIKSVGDVLRKYADVSGAVCRLGGDEFILMLPDMDKERAHIVAAQIERETKKCLVGDSESISMSFGFKEAEYTADETAETLVSIADSDMYQEKRSRKSAR